MAAQYHRVKVCPQQRSNLGLNSASWLSYDALANNEESVLKLGDETLKKIAHELADNLCSGVGLDL